MAGAERKKRVGRTIGQGTFAEVKFAVDADTGAAVAMKVLDKAAILNHRMLHQVLAGQTKIYIILELVTGGELFDKIGIGLLHKLVAHQIMLPLRWFKKNYVAVRCGEDGNVNLDDVQAIFDNIEDKYVSEQMTHNDGGPLMMNAFEMIILSQGLDLSALFDRQQEYVKCQTRFVSRKPAKTVVATIEVVSESMGLKVHSQNYELRLEGVSLNRMSPFAVVLEVFEVAPSLFMVDVQKVAGDTGIPQVLQELMQQIGQHNLEANRGFCKIYIAEDDHLQASY